MHESRSGKKFVLPSLLCVTLTLYSLEPSGFFTVPSLGDDEDGERIGLISLPLLTLRLFFITLLKVFRRVIFLFSDEFRSELSFPGSSRLLEFTEMSLLVSWGVSVSTCSNFFFYRSYLGGVG